MMWAVMSTSVNPFRFVSLVMFVWFCDMCVPFSIVFSVNEFSRLEVKAQVPKGVNVHALLETLRARIASVPNVLSNPGPVVDILETSAQSTTIIARPRVRPQYLEEVAAAINRLIHDVCQEESAATQEPA